MILLCHRFDNKGRRVYAYSTNTERNWKYKKKKKKSDRV